MVVRDENTRLWKRQRKELKDIFMTRKDCYGIHQGRNNHNSNMKKEKAMFWTKLVGLITALTTFIGFMIAYISSKLNS